MKINIFLVLLTTLLVIPNVLHAAEEDITIIINNQEISLPEDEQKPTIIDGRTYVPIRVISENLGSDVEWKNNTVVIKKSPEFDLLNIPLNDTGKVKIVIDNTYLDIPLEMGQAFISDKGRTMIPLRIIAESLGCEVTWNDGILTINKIIIEEEKNDNESIDENVRKAPIISIMGKPIATEQQIKAFMKKEEKRIKIKMERMGREFVPFPDVIGLYLEIGNKYGIRGDLAYCQAVKETGYFQYTGQVLRSQNNYCGLGATGAPLTGEEPLNGVSPSKVFYIPNYHGISFIEPEVGVEAHIQHLYAYTAKGSIPRGRNLYDPRFTYVKRGVSKNWNDLNGKWAVPGIGYGESIILDYWQKIFE